MSKMKVPSFADLLKGQVANAAGSVLNGKFAHFCDALKEHYRGVEIKVESEMSSEQVADALEKVGFMHMPSAWLRKEFEEQITALRAAKIEKLHFDPIIPAGT